MTVSRRNFLRLAAGAVVLPALHNVAEAQRMSTQGYVLGPTEGEQLIRNAGSILIKVDPSKGSNNMALGTQQVPIRTGILVHQHQEADEVLFVLEGTGFGMLDDARMPVEKGSAIYVPKGVWHGVENPDSELLLLWVVAPPGLEEFFREVASAPGAPPKQLTRDQLNEIARNTGCRSSNEKSPNGLWTARCIPHESRELLPHENDLSARRTS
jgi:mannose-6-phosphate isomerase-like protein (cupin superfamily)